MRTSVILVAAPRDPLSDGHKARAFPSFLVSCIQTLGVVLKVSSKYSPVSQGHTSLVRSPAESMRRAAIQAFRTARRAPVWKVTGKRPCSLTYTHNSVRGLRSYSGGRRPSLAPASLQSSMHLRRFSFAVISTVVASGAWYAYRGDGTVQSLATQVRGFASSAITSAHAEDPSESTRRALLVSNDQFYTATLSGDQPLSKNTDDSDRRVLEMLTPEQATEKLRKNEESYLVNRGKGVVRYDIVQVPSNSPIEDDHAEKIVEVSPSTAANTNGGPNSDWMFWAVFDGHS